MIETLGNVLVIISTVLNLELITRYHKLSQGTWQDTPMGRHVMAYMATTALILLLASLRFILVLLGVGDPTWFQVIRTAVFITLPAVFLWRRHLIVQVHKEAEHDASH